MQQSVLRGHIVKINQLYALFVMLDSIVQLDLPLRYHVTLEHIVRVVHLLVNFALLAINVVTHQFRL